MAFHEITYNRLLKQANLYGRGCNFGCRGCSYKVNSSTRNGVPLSVEAVKRTLEKLDVTRVHFLGGEPTLNHDLPEIAGFAKKHLGTYTKIGHCNGSGLPAGDIDAMSVSIKAYADEIHIAYTGVSNASVLQNFRKAHEMGIEVDAASVLIPGCIGGDEIARIAAFISRVDPKIPYHIIGYVPPEGSPWRKPSPQEMELTVSTVREILHKVTYSLLDTDDLIKRRYGGIRYLSSRVA
jgi:pyruvate formate lyase activating enzyme